jgi:hypothetical protein
MVVGMNAFARWQVILAMLVIAIVVGFNRTLRFDPDLGGYKPAWNNKATYPKMWVHGVTAYMLMDMLLHLGTVWYAATVLMLIAILAYEWSQRFTNEYDIIAGLIGSAIALILHRPW